MKRFISALIAFAMIISMVPAVFASEGATLDFSDEANRTSITEDASAGSQTWQQNGVTLINDGGRVAAYSNPVRLYQGTDVTIEYPGMTKLVIECKTTGYADALVNSITDENATVSRDSTNLIVTIEFTNAVDSFKINDLTEQTRFVTLTAYAADGGDVEAPVETEAPVVDETEAPTAAATDPVVEETEAPTAAATDPVVEETEAPTEESGVGDYPQVGVAYKYGMIQENVSTTDVYYLTGAMSGYYMATTTDVTAAIDVYLEATEGGYYLYTVIDGAIKYINMVVSGSYVNGAYEDTAATVYTYDAEKDALIAVVSDTEYWIGTRNDKSYTTVGPVKVSYNGFYCKLYAITDEPEVTEPVVEETEAPTEAPCAHESVTDYLCDECSAVVAPEADTTLNITEANSLGTAHSHNTFTSGKYYVTGVITEVKDTTYGNMYIADENGNTLYVYGVYSADGSTRYDAMELQPVVGDTITVYGVIGQYNGTAQMKNGWVTEHIVTEVPEETEPEATEPEATEPEATEPEATEPEATEPEATEPEATEPADTTLVLGDNTVTLVSGDQDGETLTYTVAEDGSLTINITSLMAPNMEGVLEEVPADYISMQFGRNFSLQIDGVPVYEMPYSFNVTAGQEISVTLLSYMGNEAIIGLNLTAGETIVVEPGTSSENPLVIDSIPYEIVVDGEHDLYYSYTATENVTLLITHAEGNYVSGLSNYEQDDAGNYITTIAAGETVIINPWGSVAGTYTISVYVEEETDEPTTGLTGSGSSSDPYVIPAPGTYELTGTDYVYVSYTTAVSGKMTINMDCTNWSFVRLTNQTSNVSQTLYAADGSSDVYEMYEGDTVSGYLYITSDNGETGGQITVTFEECEVDKTVSVTANKWYLPLDVLVPAGSRVKCQVSYSSSDAVLHVSGTGFYAMIGETKYEPDENGDLALPLEAMYSAQTVYLYNDGAEDVTCTYYLAYNVGTQNNPEVLESVNDKYTAALPEGGYYYTWTATESGLLTVTMLDESNWSYSIENLTTGVSYYDPSWNSDYTSQNYVGYITVEVNAGDIIVLEVMHEDWSAGELNFSVSFVACAIEPFINLSANTYELPLTSDPIAAGAAVRYEVYSSLNGGALTITGSNFYVVVGGTGVYNEETGLFLPEGGTKYEPDESGVVSVTLPDYSTSTVHVVNVGTEEATVEFGYNFPLGTSNNPDVVVDNVTVTLPENANPYYFAYTATGNGYILVTVSSASGVYYTVMNETSWIYGSEVYTEDVPHTSAMPVYTGDLVMIPVNTWENGDVIPGGDVTVSVTLVETELGVVDGYSLPGTIDVPASGSAAYMIRNLWDGQVSITGENFHVLVNGETLEPVDGVVIIPAGTLVFEVVNDSEEVNTLTTDVYYPLGHIENPEILTEGDYTAVLPEEYGYASRYYYQYTAEADGTIVFTFMTDNWDLYITPVYQYPAGADYGTVYTMDVEAGTTYYFGIVTGDWSTGTLSFNFALSDGEDVGGEDEVTYNQWGEIVDGDNYVEVEAGYVPEYDDDYQWYYVATSTGNLTISVIELLAYVEEEGAWSGLALRALGTGSLGSSVTLLVNGEQVLYNVDSETASVTVEVNPGDVVMLSMVSANGTALRATLNVVFESNLHDASDGILIDGNNAIHLGAEGTWTYTATEAGNLIIKLLSAGYTSEDIFGDMVSSNFQPSELLSLMDGIVSLTVNGEAYVVDYDAITEDNLYQSLVDLTVAEGDEVVLVFANSFWAELDMVLGVSVVAEDVPSYTEITELPAELVAELNDDNCVDGKTWLYTVEHDGTLVFNGWDSLPVEEGGYIVLYVDGEYAELDENGCLAVTAGQVVSIRLSADYGCTMTLIVNYLPECEHVFESVVTDPTYTEQGYTTHTCTICGYSYVDSYTDCLVHNGWVKEDGNWYFYVEGVEQTGWILDGDKWYYMDDEGVMLRGWILIDDTWYYLNNSKVTGWQKISEKWYYFDSNGAMQSGWIKLNNNWYYLNNTMVTGWQKIDGLWYYFNSNGAMQSGWIKLNDNWYYLDNEMVTGWNSINGVWYYFDASGVMQTGWIKLNGAWYYLDSTGAMQTGWENVNGTWYYLDSTGVMQTGWENVNGTWYYLDSKGAMQTGWIKLNSTWYYLDESGAMATGTQVIDGKTYNFADNGAWIP